MIKLRLLGILFLSLLFPNKFLKAQLYEISLDEKVAKSTLIVEGKVIDKRSFWNPNHTMIFTSNKVEVYKIFKGSVMPSTIEILTQGGSVGGDYIDASDLLTFDKGDVGTVFCYPNSISLKSPLTGNILFDVYSSKQGFLKYDLSNDRATAPFAEYDNIERKLYKLIQQKTGNNYKIINSDFKLSEFKKKEGSQRNSATATITSFTPTTVNAGALNDPANNVLTINGTGFGTPAAGKKIVFKDANNANITPDYAIESISPYINSWTDNQILVKVPSRAANGKFGIVTVATDTAFSPANLQVFFAVINASFNNGTDSLISEPRLMNTNNQGGYTLFYSINTAGSGTNFTTDSTYDNFRRASKTWKELTGANFSEGGNTNNQTVNPNDNINTIMFDNTNTGNPPIPSGTLAITYSGFSICGGAVASQKTGFDMVIRKEGVSTTPPPFVFNKSYCSLNINTLDLEATLLHELGHALNLAHIYEPQEQTNGYTTRNPAKVMHYNLTLSIGRKALDESAFAGAKYTITPKHNDYGSCRFTSEMIPTASIISPYNDCPASFPLTVIGSGTTVPIDLFHTTSNKYSDPQFTAISTVGTTAGAGVPVTNNAYYAVKTGSAGDLNFSISNYSTFPVEAQANCAEQGARIALYEVSSCPAGQNFPAPLYTTTFNANTTRTISALSANTNYLFYFDGLYSTKPSFNITFTGGNSLPVPLTDFYGEGSKTSNNLYISLQQVSSNVQVILERSTDGMTFKFLRQIAIQQNNLNKYNYVDAAPFNGNNYYRLKIINGDGSIVYSKIVLLKNNLEGQIVMYPNPVIDQLTINLSYLFQDRYNIIISDVVGRNVYSQQSGATVVIIPFTKFVKGSYFVQVTDSKRHVVSIQKIIAGK